MAGERRRLLVTWGILAGGALIVRAAFLGCRTILSADEVHYAESLHRFLEGRFIEGVSEYRSFFYPLLAVPLGKLYGEAAPALRLLSVLCGSALIIPCMLAAKRLWGERAALFAGVLIALHPNLIQYSTDAMTESLYACLILIALFLLVRFIQDGGRFFPVASGIVLGLAYLTRKEAQFILVLFIAALFVVRRRSVPLGGRFVRAAVLIGVFVTVILPYAAAFERKTGRWSLGSTASVNLSSPLIWDEGLDRERYVYSLDESGTERRIDSVGAENPLTVLWRQRRSIAARYVPNISRGAALLPLLLASPFLLLLAPLGLIGRPWRREDRGIELMLLLFGLVPFAIYAVFRIDLRYLIPFLPIYLMWCGRGCEVLASWLRENVTVRPSVAALALFIVMASLVPYTIRRYRQLEAAQPVEYREVGRWIAEHGGEGARVLAPSGWSVGYYAGNPIATFIPWTDADGLVRFARYHRFEYLVIGDRYIEAARPTLIPLLAAEPPPPLEPLRTFTGRGGETIRLYRVAP